MTGALTADMESALLVEAAAKAYLPALCLRVVMDPAQEALDAPWAEYRESHRDEIAHAVRALSDAVRTFADTLDEGA